MHKSILEEHTVSSYSPEEIISTYKPIWHYNSEDQHWQFT